MFEKHKMNSYWRVPAKEVLENLSPEYKGHLRSLFNCQDLESVDIEFAANNEIIFHFYGDV